jgi:outer membrane PBP1 activator LpoA protein
MELALLIKKYGATPEALAPRLQQWRQRFPDHPALPELLRRASARLQAQVKRVNHIAVLLPESGRYAAAARALRDGIMAAWFALPEAERPLLRFYDSSDPYNAWPQYSKAVAAGAEAVIGPLQKSSVAQLLNAGQLAVPVLALNHVDTQTAPPDKLYLFALDPENEARLVAERIWQQGQRHPVALYPDTPWGQRLIKAFVDRWQALTGEDIERRAYQADSADHSRVIRELLHLNLSKARHQRLERWLGQSIEFEPRRRHDVDAVFVAAHPQQAQELRPQLAFFRAGDLPMLTTSAAWTGALSPQQLADMKGILLPDIPLLADPKARARLGQSLPGVLGPGVRLYAMGMDALHLLPHLQRLQDSPYESLDGHTGNLFMTADHRIMRQLVWLSLDNPPKVLGYSARMDLEQAPKALESPRPPPPARSGDTARARDAR